jgi:hypothetical protein
MKVTINDLTRIFVRPSILDADILPSAGDEIAFRCPSGLVIEGAMVTETDFFCGQYQFFVQYETTNCVGRFIEMTGWVAQEQVV